MVQVSEALLHYLRFLFRERPVLAIYSFANTGKCFDAVARVETGRINLMLVPFPVRQAFRTRQHAFASYEQLIERIQFTAVERVLANGGFEQCVISRTIILQPV